VSRRARGFTLLEVMLALAILGGTLAVLIRSGARNAQATQDAKALTVVTGLARAKMYDLEEQLTHDGFQETAETVDGDFSEEGYPKIKWSATIEKVELPGVGMLENAAGQAGAEGEAGAQSPLAGMLGGLGADDASGAMGLSVIQSQFEMVKQVLEKSIRKVTLTIVWHVGKREDKLAVVCYFTNPTAVDEAVQGISALESLAGGSGSGTGTNPNPSPNPTPTPGGRK
jgi:general secretion pathway protein I